MTAILRSTRVPHLVHAHRGPLQATTPHNAQEEQTMADRHSNLYEGPWPPAGLDPVARGLPRHLGMLLAGLVALTPEGRRIVLSDLGPGSRLVLEALRLIEVDGNELTELGERAVTALDDLAAEATTVTSLPMRRSAAIAKVEPQSPQSLAAFYRDVPPKARETYNLFEDRPGQSDLGAPVASVLVIVSGTNLLLWQASGDREVVLVDTGEPLPSQGPRRGAVVPNVNGESPALVLRHTLGLSEHG